MRLSIRTSIVGALVGTLAMMGTLPAYGSSNKPSAPRAVHASADSASAHVSWTKPVSTGASLITKYVVTSTPLGRTCSTLKLTCTVSGLKSGTSYSFSVVAFNKDGAGPRSLSSNKVIPKASTANVRLLVVKPSTGLSNGEKVTVSGSGFTPKDSIYLVECLANASGQNGCKLPTSIPTPITVTATGVLPTTTFTVLTGTIGSGKCGTTVANAAACAISAGNATGGDTAQAVIKFKA
ncbi:MAG: hypothetical protein HKL85_02945 [Acidimicrobiaceae bacterium]|nr:hypothetical protein [Acidimicrobiaceae bacterium]